MTQYNIYFGTVGKTLGCKYRYTKWCKDEAEALKIAKNAASSMYYKYEGQYGIPSYNKIVEESEITEIDIEKLYKEHIEDTMRYYVIPTSVDTVPEKKLKY